MHRFVRPLLAAALTLSCGVALAASAGKPPLERLPGWAVPEAYSLAFRIDPAKSHFSGTDIITVELKKPSDHVWLHGKKLDVSSVTVTTADGQSHAADYVEAAPRAGVVRVDFGRTLQPQEIRLTFKFKAPFNHRLQGLYKVVNGGEPYVMTQMEPISARYAFPSFDEPRFKTPYNISLTIPVDDKGFANTKRVDKASHGNGWKTLTFAQTKPLPTYLVAYAVGPWSVVKGPAISPDKYRSEPVQLRGIAPKGKAKYMHWILGQTPDIIHALEKYYAFGYPFGKLDLVAVPDFSAGAMENAGFVTFRDYLLLLKPDSAAHYYRTAFDVAAHELAHQWTGDTVTLQWWNDIWLNEAFATWMQQKVTHKLHPEYRGLLQRVEGAQEAMRDDSLVSARKIRQPITGNGDIQTAFDAITYQKGAAVIGMFENYVGKKTFRKGMRAYIHKHKFGNADGSDLVDAIAKAAGKGERFKRAFKSFLNQTGVPEVVTKLDCSGDHPVLHVTQHRYLPLGSKGDPERTWGIPVCVRDAAGVSCQLLDGKHGTMQLAGSQCPAWYMPNAHGNGYYRFSMAASDRTALNAHLAQLDDAEKLAYADAVDAAFHRGEINAAEALAILPELASSNTVDVALAPLRTFRWIWHHEARTKAQKAKLTALVKAAYLPRLQKLGYVSRDDESSDAAHMRAELAKLFGLTVKVPAVRKALLKQGDAVLGAEHDGHLAFASANSDLLGTVLGVEVQVHGKPVVSKLMQQLGTVTNPAWRNAMIAGLLQATGKQAERVRNFALTDAIKVGEMRLMYVDRDTAEARTASWNWFVTHFDQVMARTGTFGMGYLPRMGGGCSVAEAKRNRAFFTPRLDEIPGAKRGLAQTNEQTLLCAALKQAQDPKAIMKL
ncbi:MAG TPA: M1 family metallopeptidase [Oleiagrimonas sp.]|nr:M1 family metallopeptidase [Oleiagrimonas sp.]